MRLIFDNLTTFNPISFIEKTKIISKLTTQFSKKIRINKNLNNKIMEEY